MALFENFPYTNLHELNLDWLIKELNKLKDEEDFWKYDAAQLIIGKYQASGGELNFSKFQMFWPVLLVSFCFD